MIEEKQLLTNTYHLDTERLEYEIKSLNEKLYSNNDKFTLPTCQSLNKKDISSFYFNQNDIADQTIDLPDLTSNDFKGPISLNDIKDSFFQSIENDQQSQQNIGTVEQHNLVNYDEKNLQQLEKLQNEIVELKSSNELFKFEAKNYRKYCMEKDKLVTLHCCQA